MKAQLRCPEHNQGDRCREASGHMAVKIHRGQFSVWGDGNPPRRIQELTGRRLDTIPELRHRVFERVQKHFRLKRNEYLAQRRAERESHSVLYEKRRLVPQRVFDKVMNASPKRWAFARKIVSRKHSAAASSSGSKKGGGK